MSDLEPRSSKLEAGFQKLEIRSGRAMSRVREWMRRFAGMFDGRRRDAQLEEELQSHLEMLAEEKMQRGMKLEEAKRAARIELGGTEQIKEAVREQRGLAFVESLMQDVRFSLRMLRKTPGFTAIAILTLALGIGANTAIFTLINAVVLRDLPVDKPEELVRIGSIGPRGGVNELSPGQLRAVDREQAVFSGVFGWNQNFEDNANIEANGQRTTGVVLGVTGEYYSTLGVAPFVGRLIEPSDVDLALGTPTRVAVVGYHFWRSTLGGDPQVVGKILRIEDVPFTIIGVTRPGFTGMEIANEDSVTIPLTAQALTSPGVATLMQHNWVPWLAAIGRLKPGVTIDQARSQLDSVWPAVLGATNIAQASPASRDAFLKTRPNLSSASRGYGAIRGYAEPLYAVMAIAALILVIACVNLASLMLSRAAARGHEIAVRAALGAGRARVARQFVIEAIILSFSGVVLGIWLAVLGSRGLRDFISGGSSLLGINPDLRVLAFAAFVGLVTAISFSIAPALRAARQDPEAKLREKNSSTARLGWTGRILIVAQIALSVVLVMESALFVRSLQKLRAVPLGFHDETVVYTGLREVPNGYKRMSADDYYPQLIRAIGGMPGVSAASITKNAPFSLLGWTRPVAPAMASALNESATRASWAIVSPGFFGTVQMNLLSGRDFTWQDNSRAQSVAILSENLAHAIFPSGDAIGRLVRDDSDPNTPPAQVVGVVNDARIYGPRQENAFAIYVPYLQAGFQYPRLLVRTSLPPESLGPALRREVASFGYEFAGNVDHLAAINDANLLNERLTATLAGFFGGLALALAIIGILGVMSYSVAQRTREMGIRMAIGAQRGDVLGMVVRETAFLVAAGLCLGVPCALAGTRLIAHMLFNLSPSDPATLAVVAAMLILSGMLAGYLPARRAMRVDPMVVLRHE